MRVGAITASYTHKIKKQNQKQQSFKADVQIGRIYIDSFGEKNQLKYNEVCALNSLLKYAQTAYKNVGTDNNLVILYPYLEKDEKTKQQYADIEVCFMNKNAEEARRAILNNKHRLYREYGDSVKKDLQALADRDETAMKSLTVPYKWSFIRGRGRDWGEPLQNVPTKKDLDFSINCIVKDKLSCYIFDTEKELVVIEPPKPKSYDNDIYMPIGGW
ncbi:MAG: hypothetical protein ACLSUS_07250 [Opitutales bacterium]